MENTKSIFIESLENHQRLVDTLLTHENAEGICEITEEEILSEMKRSSAWLKKAIKKINTEDTCIEIVGYNKYKVNYKNLYEKGVFNLIFQMMLCTLVDDNIFKMKNKELMEKFDCTLKTVQMYRAYLSIGWKQAMAQEEMMQK